MWRREADSRFAYGSASIPVTGFVTELYAKKYGKLKVATASRFATSVSVGKWSP
jgi:hypothetical protein